MHGMMQGVFGDNYLKQGIASSLLHPEMTWDGQSEL